jgi:Ca2+-dependent lipid-binding protein
MNSRTLIKENIPLSSLIENSGSLVIKAIQEVNTTHNGEVDPYVTFPANENPSPLRNPSTKPMCI